MKLCHLCLISALSLTSLAAAEDWSQWRGPNGNGASKGRVIVGGQALKTAWALDVGTGYAAPSVADGRVFILGYKAGKDTVRALNRKTGKEIWSYSYNAKNFSSQNAGGTAATPSIAGKRVLTLSRDGQLHCFEASSGKILWKNNVGKQLGVAPPAFGFSGSPVVEGNKIYLELGVIACFNLKDGKLHWKTKNFGTSYSTPSPFQYQNKSYIACYPGSGLVVVDTSNGDVVAEQAFKHKWPNIHAATPLVSKNGQQIFISSGYKLGCMLLNFDGQSLKEAWSGKMMRNEMATSILTKTLIIGFDNAVLKAIDRRNGEVLWNKRGLGKGSLIQVGKDLVILSDKGELIIAPIDRAGFKARHRQGVLNGRGCWSAPVWSNGQLLIRDPMGQLVCLNNNKKGATPKPTKKKKKFY